jgi:hypothetical protein
VATLSAKQIYALARGAGLNESRAIIATAVALAESSGRTDATGPTFGEKGLWQVYPKAHPDWDSGGNLYDPAYNAKAMADISNGGTNWQPWTTYKNGAYKSFLPVAAKAAAGGGWQQALANIASFPLRIPGDVAGLGKKGEQAITGAAESAGEKIVSSIWNKVGAKVLFVGFGIALVGLGAYQTFKPQIQEKKQEAAQLAGVAAKGAAVA